MAVNSSNPLNAVAAALVVWASLLTLPLGIVGSLSDTGPMRMVFAAMAAAGAGMLYGGVRMWRQWRRAVVVEREHQMAIRAAVGAPPAEHGPGVQPAAPAALQSGEPVLACWTYGAAEWRQYTRSEWKRRVLEAAFVGVALLLVGYCSGRGRGEEGQTFMAAAVLMAALIVAGSLWMAHNARRANESAPGEAVITPTAILLNGRYHVLANDVYRFEGVTYDGEARPPLLEFSISWGTRRGRGTEKIRVPVPAGREREAREVLAAFGEGAPAPP